MNPSHLPKAELIRSWPAFSANSPLRVLVSACLAGDLCGVDGTANGEYPLAQRLLRLPNVRAVKFCPEHVAFGTPRRTPDIEGGDGFDVMDGCARVVSDTGDDWTAGLRAAAYEMRELAVERAVHLALLMDVSAACGSTVIYDGPRSLRTYRRGPGVAAAALIRAGVPVVSQRDERTLALIFAKLDVDASDRMSDNLDHHERFWYRDYFSDRA